MPPMVIATAYLHAINYTLYGVDVTEKWLTATQNASALEKAYRKGCYDAMERVKPPAQPDNRLTKIADLMDGTIDHFDLDDAMDLLYQIKGVLKDG